MAENKPSKERILNSGNETDGTMQRVTRKLVLPKSKNSMKPLVLTAQKENGHLTKNSGIVF